MHMRQPEAGSQSPSLDDNVGAEAGTVDSGKSDLASTTLTPGTGEVASASGAADSVKSEAKRQVIDVHSIELNLTGTYAQSVDWGVVGTTSLIIDEPEPLGENSGPSPARVLSAALASCLGASLLFCLRKSRIEVMGLHTTAHTELVRNERGRLRVGTITVRLEPVVAHDDQPRMARCIEVFEDYCVVTASVRPAVTVNVSVHPVSPPAH